ncbi:MAG: FAD-dependent thymidylate synthase [Thermosipho sp. (in: Bacteria)]|nr:FAD-dependent thymidylate synthase [Thermosipho sp. (in: thermotogales)]
MKVELISYTPNPERLVASSAKLCYSPVGINEIQENLTLEKTKKFIEKLMSLGHESPLEHITFTFAIEGVSRSLTHQLVRHRVASYSQQSQRYVKLDHFEYVVPKLIEESPKAKRRFIEEMEKDQKAYDDLVTILLAEEIRKFYNYEGVPYDELYARDDKELIEEFKKYKKYVFKMMEKKAIENARYVLPNACETKIVVTMNARSLLNFFKHRCCNRAQDEIRTLADEMLRLCREVAPNIFRYAGASCIKGKCPEGEMSCGSPRIDLIPKY